MAAKPRRAAKPRAAKKTARRVRQRAATRRAARKARVARKPKAPKRAARKGRAPKRKTKGGKKPKKSKRKALKKTARRVRKPKRVTKKSQTGTRRRVWNGSAMYTKGGLTKADLMINPNGKLVSKRSRARAERNSAHIKKWVAALKKAKQELGITGFCVINRGAQGIALYSRAKEIYGN